MSGRGKGLKIKGQESLDPAAAAGAAPALPPSLLPDLHHVIAELPAALYLTDAEGHLTYYNDAAARLWGYRPPLGNSQWCGSWKLYWLDGTPMPHDQCPTALAIREDRAITGMEAIAERPDGSRVRFRPYPKPLHDEHGTLIGVLNVLIDATDQHRTAQRLDESEARYRGIFEGARVALSEQDFSGVLTLLDELRGQGVLDLRRHFATNPDLLAQAVGLVRVSDVNQYALELYEASQKSDLLASLSRTFLPKTQAIFVEELVALWEGRRRFQGETTVQTLQGRRVDVRVSIAFQGERCERTLVSIVNITASKAAHRALREERQRLETLNRVARVVSSDLELERIVQAVTDLATEAAGAQFGAFFYNMVDGQSESYVLYALTGAPREAFAKFGLPRNTALFHATFRGLGPVRSDDIRTDPRYGKSCPIRGCRRATCR